MLPLMLSVQQLFCKFMLRRQLGLIHSLLNTLITALLPDDLACPGHHQTICRPVLQQIGEASHVHCSRHDARQGSLQKALHLVLNYGNEFKLVWGWSLMLGAPGSVLGGSCLTSAVRHLISTAEFAQTFSENSRNMETSHEQHVWTWRARRIRHDSIDTAR